MSFDHLKIEKKWQSIWSKNNIYKVDIDSKKEKFYALDMFPYPSGAGLHVGHVEGYTATDIISRMKKAKGFEVLHPMGWDAFGLPAEQYAIKTGNSPAEFTKKNIEVFKKQLNSLGFSFDWSREISTIDPNYFKITQWIFAQLYKKGLAETKEIEANWSPSLNTVLANEEVIEDKDGNLVSERDGLIVEKRIMKQWVLKITKYVDKLFEGLENLDWPDSVKRLQKNWFFKQNSDGSYSDELHIKDWIFARQRYWGEPFPIIHLENGETYLVPESEYPIELPKLDDYKFTQDEKPALGRAKDWVEVEVYGIKGKRDLNTMPQWAGSNWYYIAYILKEGNSYLALDDPKSKARLNNWLPVDLYIGGQEHAVLHLIYARFWHIFLNEIGILDAPEPFAKLFNQGMILGPDGLKMSKSKGNVINPNEIIENYGADSLRVYEMFMGALDDDKPWSAKGLQAAKNWLNRVYVFFTKNLKIGEPSNKIKFEFNKMLESLNSLYEELKFNVAISKMMIFINEAYKDNVLSLEIIVGFLKLLSCIAPHISDEIYSQIINEEKWLYGEKWPLNLKLTKKINEDKIVIVQINGKVKLKLKNPDFNFDDEDKIKKIMLTKLPNYLNNIDDIKKIYFVDDKLINIVLKK